MTFGENLRTLRNSRSLSQKDLAQKLGFSFQNISKWERSDSLPDIETLLAIAQFFGTTTDALLGHVPQVNFATLRIGEEEVKLCRAYPSEEWCIKWKIVCVIDGAGKITAVFSVSPWYRYSPGYVRGGYDPFDAESTVLYECPYRKGKETVTECKRIQIPAGGFLIVLSDTDFVTKRIMQFIIPEEHRAYLNCDTHSGYRNPRNGRNLFGNILKHNELDFVTVELCEGGILFKKPAESVDPMSVNIEVLAKIVRRELEKEHNQQIKDLKDIIEELRDTVEDNEGRIDDLEGQIEELTSRLEELGEEE